MSAPQRFLANDRNLIRTATLTPSAVQAVANAVIETPLARAGSAQLKLTGSYSGIEDATYDFQIEDLASGTKLISQPVYTGVGSETLANVASTTAAQDFTLECHSAGQPAVAAAVEIEGVSIVARAGGVAGNGIHVNVDVSGLVFTASNFSLIEAVTKGAGADASPLIGPQYDWDTAAMGADGLIPSTAHRFAFEGDESNVYVGYKKFVDNAWQYFTVPGLLNDYAAGTRVLFVSGSYTVSIIDDGGSPPVTDTLTGVVTVYDFLNAVKTTSTLCDVDGVIANDRSPTGQAAREFALRTEARALLSTGEGSKAATGFIDITVEPDANTELVTAECIAIDFKLDPQAFVGHEAWTLKGSVSGVLGTIYTDEPFAGATFGLTIPQKLPPTTGNSAGRFSLSGVQYASRDAGGSEVEICFAGKLGPNAVDQTLTLVYTARPPEGCNCESMPVPQLNTRCLGGAGSDTAMGYSAGAQTRIDDLYDWVSSLAGKVTRYVAGKGIPPYPATTFPPDSETASATVSGDGFSSTKTFSSSTLTGGTDLLTVADIVDTGYADAALPAGFTALVDQFDSTLQLIDALGTGAPQTAGFTAWDDALTAIQGDLNDSELSTLGHRLASVASLKYQLMLRRSLAAAGISPLGKSSASTQTSGDGCWQDYGDAFYWKVTGTDGEYAPAFTNHAYWSSRKNDAGVYFSTKEFAFILNVKCPQNLVVGDTVTLTIGNAAALGTYQVGDILKLPLIAAADQFLAGGIDANAIQKWYVTGSVDGAFAVYTFDPGSPSTYFNGGLTLKLVMGGIDPAAGDTFLFSVIGARYKWRKNGGAYSAAAEIPSGATAFDSGLSFTFIPGAEPSFVAGDTWTFRALQKWAVSNLAKPDRKRWFPGVATSNVYAEFASVQTLDAVGIALHTIPEGASITLTGGNVLAVQDWSETIVWQAGAIVQFLSQLRTALWVQLNLATADASSIGWLWVGQAATTALSADVTLKRNYSVVRGQAGGLYQGGAFLGKSVSATVSWQEGSLTEADAAMLSGSLDYVKSNNDEPILFVPQFTRPADVLLAQIVEDEIPLPDVFDYNPNVDRPRALSASLTLQGVWT